MKKIRKFLVGDVGGTNCRLAACDPTNGTISHIKIFPVRELESLEEALDHFKRSHQEHSYSKAAISIANPITGDRIAMTNAHWDFSIERTKQNCRLDHLLMLNDWESVAGSLPLLQTRTSSKSTTTRPTNSVTVHCAGSEPVSVQLD